MPAAKKTTPNEALYDKLIATIPEIESKGDANPYTSLNGNMFTLLQSIETCDPPAQKRAREIPEEVPIEFV